MKTLVRALCCLSLLCVGCAEQPGKKKEETTKTETKTVDGKVVETKSEKTVDGKVVESKTEVKAP
jgi:hypothetical protein